MILALILCSFFQSTGGIYVSINNQPTQPLTTVLATQDDSIKLSTKQSVFWILYEPIKREYDNLSKGVRTIEKIEYKTKKLKNQLTNSIDLKLSPGTYNIGFSRTPIDSTFSTFYPLTDIDLNIVQVTIREDDSYLGYLTELLGLPFVIPPKLIGSYGHQTDLRLGTDCAELAIYGKRRMGFNIPYCGPRGILEYLKGTDDLNPGTIIHFGHQVSILYEDRGNIGILDHEDLLIHAYQDKVAIEALNKTELADKEYRLYTWKDLK